MSVVLGCAKCGGACKLIVHEMVVFNHIDGIETRNIWQCESCGMLRTEFVSRLRTPDGLLRNE